MKKVVLFSFLLLPITILAQQIDQIPSRKVKAPSIRTPEEMERLLLNAANPRVLELAVAANIYKSLGDTAGRCQATRLRPGDYVVIRKMYPHWLAVYRAQSASRFSSDTTTYYMKKTGMKGSKTFIML